MAHSDDATKTWISAVPAKNSNGNVTEWRIKYRYTLSDFVHTFGRVIKFESASKAPENYTKGELLLHKKYPTSLSVKEIMDAQFNLKYEAHTNPSSTITTDTSFDVSSLDE
jgi:hypothetical protein